MKKFIIEEEEKNRILRMHNSLKEQVQGSSTQPSMSDLEKLKLALNTCIKKYTWFIPDPSPLRKTNSGKDVIVGKGSNGNVYYFYADLKVINATTDKKRTWACDFTQEQSQSSETEASVKNNLALTKTEGGWKERKEITDTNANVNNPQMYEKQVVDGVTLYRSKASAGITSGLTEDQKSIINTWQGKGYKLSKDLTAEERKTWKEVVVSPASDGYFSQDFKMFSDPKILTQGIGTGTTKVSITTVIQNAVEDRIPKDKKDCKQTIDAYYISFKKKRPLEPNEFDALKTKTQSCKNEFYGDWGALLSGGKKVDELLDIMSAENFNSKWKLQ
jgi:hypothetical protein